MHNLLACSGPGAANAIFISNGIAFSSLVGCGLFALLFIYIYFKEKKRLTMAIVSLLILVAHPRIYTDFGGGGDCGGMMSQNSVLVLFINFLMIIWKWYSDTHLSISPNVGSEDVKNA